MRKFNIQKFIEVFKQLDPCDQLLLADVLVEELHKSDRLIEQDGFNRDLCGMIMPELEKFISITKDKLELGYAKELLDRFDRLPVEYQEKTMEQFLTGSLKDEMKIDFETHLLVQEHDYKQDVCKNEGHLPSEWEEVTFNGGIKGYMRQCPRCGRFICREEKPKEFIK